jgi:aspartyl-tRNA synthetase
MHITNSPGILIFKTTQEWKENILFVFCSLKFIMSTAEELTVAIADKGEQIRLLKVEKPPTLKTDLEPLIAELLQLKITFKEITGQDFGPKVEEKKKVETKTEKVSEGPSKTELNKLKKKEQKAAAKAADKAEQGTEVTTVKETTTTVDSVDPLAHLYGDSPRIQSAFMTEKVYRQINEIDEDHVGQSVWLRARVATSRAVGKGIFVVLRQTTNTIQSVMFQGEDVPKAMVKYASGISLESIVDIRAVVTIPDTPVLSATVKNFELKINEIHVISRAQELPFMVEDAGRSEADAAATGLPVVSQDTSLNFRWVDTRTPANQAIFRIQSGVCQLFREFFNSRNFIEIHTPKLIAGASEGGSSVFKLKYFNQDACLAQSPQFYKQMVAACGGFERVYEIGPVFRAEDSNTNR